MKKRITSCWFTEQVCAYCTVLLFDNREIQKGNLTIVKTKCKFEVKAIVVQSLNKLQQFVSGIGPYYEQDIYVPVPLQDMFKEMFITIIRGYMSLPPTQIQICICWGTRSPHSDSLSL